MWRTWLIILMTVLTPLRGWAWAVMSIPAAPTTMLSAAHIEAAPATVAMPACHEEAAGDTRDQPPAHTPCSHCDVCHAVMASPLAVVWPEIWAPDTHQARGLSQPPGLLHADRLFRPPRV